MSGIISVLSSAPSLLVFMCLLPVLAGVLVFALRKSFAARAVITGASALINLIFAVALYFGKAAISVGFTMAPFGLSPKFLINEYSSLFLFLTAAAFAVISTYATAWLKDKEYAGLFMLYLLISLGMLNGAFMSDSLPMMLFFWEGLLCTLFGSLLIGNRENHTAAVKALTLSGIADLLLMLGIIITCYVSKTTMISEMSGIPVRGAAAVGFYCLMAGAVGKAGCMPFHSWIPVAADSAPLPFMAAFPGALEKLLAFFLAVKTISTVYDVAPGSVPSLVIMTVGAVTLVCAVAMALIQKDMKKLLSYHAVSQVGYMVLGIGSVLPVGIAGGLFHMFNNVVYKSALFMVAGMFEQKLGTTDLRKFSGLRKKMPVTCVCFTICGLSIAGVPGFNGFFSKELIFDAAYEVNVVFYICALVGAFMTAVSFLKMGRAAFAGETTVPDGADIRNINEKGVALKVSMCIMSALCIGFGVFNSVAVDGWFGCASGAESKLGGWPHSAVMVIISVCVLLLALADHAYGCKKTGKAITAADHIHYAPGLHQVYGLAEKGAFDPYNILMKVAGVFGTVCVGIEKVVSFIYDRFFPAVAKKTGNLLHNADNGSLSRYISGVLVGAGIVAVIFIYCIID